MNVQHSEDMLGVVNKYIDLMGPKNSLNHRFSSWNHCYKAFGESEDIDYLSLHLAFYLASWGMYRGSCGLLWRDYRVHLPVVEMLLKNKVLRKDKITDNDIPIILTVYDEIKGLYPKEEKEHPISVTGTLASKILLGTLGCLPAFDRYFNAGFGKNSIQINEYNLKSIISFANYNESEIKHCQEVRAKGYPQMKILDMYFWQKGYQEANDKKQIQAQYKV